MATDIVGKTDVCPKCGTTDRYKDGKCKACGRLRVKNYTEKNKDRVRAYYKEWSRINAEKIKANDRIRSAKYRSENREKRLETCRAYARANPEKVAASKRNWKKNNPEIVRQQHATRRALKESAPVGSMPRGTVKRILGLQKMKCACCHTSLHDGYHVDHIQPLSRGGKHEANNLQALCAPCNLSKHAKDPIDFMQSKGFLL